MNGKKDIKFNSINASSLFHFTKKKETLESILSNGLRFSYAFESISPQITANINYPSNPIILEEVYKDTGVAIPMISFCDIPIIRTSIHMGRYGKYMIGFDKRCLTELYKSTINPVLYIHSGNLSDAMVDLSEVYAETFKKQIENIVSLSKKGKTKDSPEFKEKTTTLGLRKFFILFLYGLIKPVYDPKEARCYYDEREWRAFLPDDSFCNDIWKWEITKDDYDYHRDEWNNGLAESFDNYLTLYEDYLRNAITHIVVSEENEVDDLIKFVMESEKIFGYPNVSKENRLYLVSRITSIERIELDY